ncbi:MAG: type II secretion system minor pseudopilin GspK [Pseudomonadota bacterium]
MGGARIHRQAFARRQRGVAVLTVLLIVAIGSALAFSLATQQTMVVAQSRQTLVGGELRNLLLGGEVLARQVLYQDWEEDKEEGVMKDTLLETWARVAPPFEIPGGYIEIQARDLHSCFNLNSISADSRPDDESIKRIQRLLTRAELDPQLADRWRDWVDTDEEVYKFGAEDSEYLAREIAFRTPNQAAAHVSEFRLIADEMTIEQYAALREAACVPPDGGAQINVNTVGVGTLEILQENFGPTEAAAVVEGERDYDDTAAFLSDNSQLRPSQPLFTVTSQFFEVSIRAELDGETAEMVSILFREPADGSISVLGRDYSRRFVSRLQVEIEEEDA